MYIKLKDADKLCFSSCDGCEASCCDGGRFILAPLVLEDFVDVYEKFLIAFAWIDDEPRAVMLISNRDKPCVYYKDNECSIYNERPPACVMYPFTPYYDDVLIDTACQAVGDTGFALKQQKNQLLDQVHPNFYHHRLEHFTRKLEETGHFLKHLTEGFQPLFEVEGVLLMAYIGDIDSVYVKMHHASLRHADSWNQ